MRYMFKKNNSFNFLYEIRLFLLKTYLYKGSTLEVITTDNLS